MFNTVALILRPEEIRLFIVLFGALAAAAVAAVARWLRRVLARTLADAVNHLTPMLLSSTHLIARRRHAKP